MSTARTLGHSAMTMRLWAPVLATAIVLALWEILAVTGVFPPELPPATDIAAWLGQNLAGSELWVAVGRTLAHWLLALGIGIAIGATVGALMALVPVVHELLLGVVEFFRPIPVVVYLPIMLLLFGARPQVVVILAAVAAIWPMLLQTLYGMRAIEPVMRDTARVYGLSARQRLAWVAVPSLLPYFATGVRLASTITLLAAVSVELIGAVPGLGSTLSTYAANGIYDAVYGIIAVTGLIGVALDSGLERWERRVLRWHPSRRPRNA
ncbi:ABC transporter permease [Nocardia carnea]|uniref:ABC transporter permease n=1 Tax=Nocardia carnea TaxID=37328 RepID=UPI0024566406|nr:ABC transporter permease [Nocardia carnea]